jgi:hypothetical protein
VLLGVRPHAAGEDDASLRWLRGGYTPVEGVREYFGWLAANEAAGTGKRGFGISIGDVDVSGFEYVGVVRVEVRLAAQATIESSVHCRQNERD